MLRHVSPAFAEDPLRVLRVARFAARFAKLGFTVAPETLSVDGARSWRAARSRRSTPERVWQETAQGARRGRSRGASSTCCAHAALCARVFPEVDALFGVPQPERWHPEIDTGVHVLLALDDGGAARARSDGALRGAHARSRQRHDAASRAARASRPRAALARSCSRALCERLRVPNRVPRPRAARRAPSRHRAPRGRAQAAHACSR